MARHDLERSGHGKPRYDINMILIWLSLAFLCTILIAGCTVIPKRRGYDLTYTTCYASGQQVLELHEANPTVKLDGILSVVMANEQFRSETYALDNDLVCTLLFERKEAADKHESETIFE